MRLSVIRSLQTSASVLTGDARVGADGVARAGVRASGLIRSEQAGLKTPAWFCLPGDLIGHVLVENGVECSARSVFELAAADCERIRATLVSARTRLPENWRRVLREEAALLSPHAPSAVPLSHVPAPVCKIWCSAAVEPCGDRRQVAHLEKLVLNHVQSLVVKPISDRVLVSDQGYIEDLCSAVLQVAASFFEDGLQVDLRSCTSLGFPPPRVWFSILVQREEAPTASGVCWSRDPHVPDFFRRRRVVFAEPVPFGDPSLGGQSGAGAAGFSWSVGAEGPEALDFRPERDLEGNAPGFAFEQTIADKGEVLEWEHICQCLEREGASSVRIAWIRSAVSGKLLVLRVDDLVDLPSVPVQDELCAAARQPELEEADWVEVTSGGSAVEILPFHGSLLVRRVEHHLKLCKGMPSAQRDSRRSRVSKRPATVGNAEAGVGLLAPEETRGAGQLALMGGRLLQRVSASPDDTGSGIQKLRLAWSFLRVLVNPPRSRVAAAHPRPGLASETDTLRGRLQELDAHAYELAQCDRSAALARKAARRLERALDRIADRSGMGSAERASLRLFDELALGSQRSPSGLRWPLKRTDACSSVSSESFPLAQLWLVCERFYAGELIGRDELERAERREGKLSWDMLQSCSVGLAREINRALSRDRFFAHRTFDPEQVAAEFWSVLLYLRSSRRGCLIRPTDTGCEAPETVRQRLPHHMRAAAGMCRRLLVWIADLEADLRATVDRAQCAGATCVRTLGQRLCDVSEVDEPADVHHLTLDELERFVDGRLLTPTLRELVLLRKRAHARQRLVSAGTVGKPVSSAEGHVHESAPLKLHVWGPLSLGCSGQEQEIVRMWGQKSQPVAQESRLNALSAVPGLVRGRVIVDAPGLNPAACVGQVLVARQIDDLWLARVGVAAAVILESDGLRSSALAVTRALRIPTLVGVRNALEELAEGDEVLVDAVQGRVQLVSRRPGRAHSARTTLQQAAGQSDEVKQGDCPEEPSWEATAGPRELMGQDINNHERLN